jgi:hypothetical protein
MANLIYTLPETAIVFTESGGDATFTPKNVATGAGRVSAQFDRGAGAKAMRYRWEAAFKTGSNITPGTSGVPVELYVATAHISASIIDSSLGASDAALTARNSLLLAQPIGVLIPTGTAAGTGPFVGSGVVEILARYISVAMWNASGQTLTNVNGDNYIKLVPMPDQVQ